MKSILGKLFKGYCCNNNQTITNQEVNVSPSPMQKMAKDKEKNKPKRCSSSNQEFYRHSNMLSIHDSFTQFSQVSQNDNHYYQELNSSALEQEITSTKMLDIEDIEGDLFFNQKLFIDAMGLKNGIRGKKDGFAFFGSITHYVSQ